MPADFGLTIDLQMSILLVTALLGYILAARANQSVVVGLILIGMFMGPSALGLITFTDFTIRV